MDITEIVATVMAAQEQLPSEPSDLTGLLLDRKKRDALLTGNSDGQNDPLLNYLCDRLDPDRISYWKTETSRLLKDGVRPVVAGHPTYPSYREGYWNPPPILFVRGSLPRHGTPSLAIIGSRQTDALALRQARDLAAEVAETGVVVISGLAAGVDTAAHLGALDAGGRTVAILGTGIDNVYPLQNEDLANDITLRGAVVSQFAPDAPRTPTSFLRRNNVIAGLSDASLVMAADERSGSRHEITQAGMYGRPVLLWRRTMSEMKWARGLVDDGLGTYVDSAQGALEMLRSTYVA